MARKNWWETKRGRESAREGNREFLHRIRAFYDATQALNDLGPDVDPETLQEATARRDRTREDLLCVNSDPGGWVAKYQGKYLVFDGEKILIFKWLLDLDDPPEPSPTPGR